MNLRRRLVRATSCVTSLLLTVVVCASPASASTPTNLRKVSFKNRTVPGSTCFAKKPIKLHNGHGKGGHHLVADLGSVRYGNVTGDHQVEAFVHIGCSTGGGTAASQAKDTWAVFTAHGRKIDAIGVISGRHQWRHVHSELLGRPHVAHKIVTITEYVYGPADADCCPSLRATTKWHMRHGKLTEKSTSIGGDLLIRSTRMGRAKLGMTLRQLRRVYSNVHSSGPSGSCSGEASFGRQYDQDDAEYVQMYAYFKHGKIFRIDPGSDNAVTDRGIGEYSSVSDVRHAYPKAVRAVDYQGNPFLHVRLKASSLSMLLDKESYGTFVAYPPVLYAGHSNTAPHC